MSEGCLQEAGLGDGAALAPLLERGAFEAAQASAGEEAARARRALARAALEVSGEVGYEAMTVGAVVVRAGASRDRFYRSFSSREECWLVAYRCGTEELCRRLLGAGSKGRDWADGLELALGELADFLEAEPALARALIVEVYVAGPGALRARRELFACLSRAMDGARREIADGGQPPPAITADFILSGIETAVRKSLLTGLGDFREQVPGLMRLALLLFFGVGRG